MKSMFDENIKSRILTAALLALVLVPFAYAADDYVLIVKPSPADAGTVSQSVPQNGFANVSATPQSGYQFVYWLGDVTDPAASTTTVSVDSPKLVIAVYERTDYQIESALGGAGAGNGYNGRPGVAPSVTVGVAPSAPGAKRYSSSSYSIPNIIDENPDNPDVPVPDETVPEPSTLVLFALAGLKLIKTRKSK